MMQYAWLNPVVLELYRGQPLEEILFQKGFQLVTCHEDHIHTVKRAYKNYCTQAQGCTLDMRCPKAVSYVREYFAPGNVDFPEIYPILIHCALELHRRYAGEEDFLTVITPCEALSQLGEGLELSNTRFMTWNAFEKENGISLRRTRLSASPIPPGFFSDFGKHPILRSRQEIDVFFKNRGYEGEAMVEMLYCQDGCHHGDGV